MSQQLIKNCGFLLVNEWSLLIPYCYIHCAKGSLWWGDVQMAEVCIGKNWRPEPERQEETRSRRTGYPTIPMNWMCCHRGLEVAQTYISFGLEFIFFNLHWLVVVRFKICERVTTTLWLNHNKNSTASFPLWYIRYPACLEGVKIFKKAESTNVLITKTLLEECTKRNKEGLMQS